MKYHPLYLLGTLLLFLSLLWLFLPHTAHEVITENHEESHLFHTVQGIGVVIASLFLMVLSNRLQIKSDNIYIHKQTLKSKRR